jgi:hypothetical protein
VEVAARLHHAPLFPVIFEAGAAFLRRQPFLCRFW